MTVTVAMIFDILMLALIVACALNGRRKGFLSALAGVFSYIIGFAVAKIFTPVALPFVKNFAFMRKFADTICAGHGNEALDAESIEKINEITSSIFSKLGDSFSDISEILGLNNIVEATLFEVILGLISNVFAFIAIFLIVVILIKIIVHFIKNAITKVKILKKTDRVLGAICGTLTGFFWAGLIAVAFMFLYQPLSLALPKWFSGETKDIPLMINVCYNYNPFKYLIVAITKLINLF